jgi:hypothetical protein
MSAYDDAPGVNTPWHLKSFFRQSGLAQANAALWRKASVSLNHAVLHFDGAAHCIHHTAKLDDAAVAGAINYAPVMHGDGRVNQITTERAQPRQCPVLVGASKSAVSDNIRSQDCYELPGFDHGTPRAYGIIAESLIDAASTAAAG